jgi:hypothetical protein
VQTFNRQAASRLLAPSFLLAFPSSAFLQKYVGLAGVVLHFCAVIGVLALIQRLRPSFMPLLEKRFVPAAALVMAGLLACFFLLHPYEDQRGPGRSSDRDEGLELAVSRMVDGKTPYYPQNDVVGPLSLLPGAILLSVPFVLTGSVGLQNWVWLGIFLGLLAWHLRERTSALVLIVASLALSPAAQYEFVSGGDMLANGIYVAVFLYLAIRCWTSTRLSPAASTAAAVVLGLGLASRANFILLLPLFSALVWRASGIQRAVAAGSLVLITYSAVILPFYLMDPGAFTPLMSRDKLAVAGQSWPWAGRAILMMTVLGAGASALMILMKRSTDPITGFFRHCTVVTLAPMLLAVCFATIVNGNLDFRFMHDRFGLMYVFFMLLGWGPEMIRPSAAAGGNR